jgi:hypothetical protein
MTNTVETRATPRSLLVIAFLAVAACPTVAQTTSNDWQAKAVEKYPTLGVKGSDLNKRFVDAYNERRKTDPRFFENPKWTMILAGEVAESAANTGLGPTDHPEAEQPPRSPTPGAPQRLEPTDQERSKTPMEMKREAGFAANADYRREAALANEKRRSEEQSLNISLVAIVGAIAAFFGVAAWIASSKAAKRRQERARLFAEAREFVALAQRRHAIPVVSARVILKPGELAFYCGPSVLFETRAVRHYESGFAGFRVAKGIYIGGSEGHSVSSQEWSRIDPGALTITDKRLIFDGDSANRSVALTKVLAMDSSGVAVEVSVEGRQKSMVFTAANPLILATIIRICCHVDDPRDLSATNLNITFAE